MKVTFLGHSAFLIESGAAKILIDPFLTHNPSTSIKAEELNDITHIFITHAHGDHIGDAVSIAQRCGATVYCNNELAHILSLKGISTFGFYFGGYLKTDFGSMKMVQASHGSGIRTEQGWIYCGTPCGFILEVEGKKIYHAGDTGLILDMSLLAVEKIDLACLPIGGKFTMDITEAARAAELIQPKQIIPMHYNTFAGIEADVQEFKQNVTCSQVQILTSGESIYL